MNIKDYRLTSMDEPSDKILTELMEQVADSARQSSAKANRILHNKLQATISQIRRNRELAL